jgi:predicted PilT family ATPase
MEETMDEPARRAPEPGRRLSVSCAFWICLLSGCGYSVGYRVPEGVRTVAVPIFDNRSFPLRREIEYELTSALRVVIQSRTSLELVDSGEADMVIHGVIREFRDLVVAEGRRDQKLEASILLTVAIIVEDFRNGRRRDEEVRVQEPYSVELGETVESARRRAVRDLADRILLVVEDWGEP